MKTKNIITNTLLFIVFLLISLLLAEIILRFLNDRNQQTYSYGFKFFQHDRTFGWIPLKNQEGYHVDSTHEFRAKVVNNKYNMRDDIDISKTKTKNKIRIAFIGDSYTWGVGVSNNQRFSNLIRSEEIETLNFGATAWGPLQYMMIMDKVISFNPDLIIVSWCLHNDFRDSLNNHWYGAYRPYALLDKRDELQIGGIPVPLSASRILQTSNIQIINAVNDLLSKEKTSFDKGFYTETYTEMNNKGQWIFPETSYFFHFIDRQYGPHPNGWPGKALILEQILDYNLAFKINDKIVKEIKNKSLDAGIPLLFMSVATKKEFYKGNIHTSEEWKTKGLEFCEKNNNKASQFQSLSKFNKLMNENDIRYMSSHDILECSDFFLNDGHWNSDGHSKVAKKLTKFLKDDGFLNYNQLALQ